jgi:CheY-like chemotaxis protein
MTMTILVVDDDEDCIATLQLALETLAEVAIRPALSAEAALRALESGTFSAVITDIHLPEMTGLELVERIRKTPRFRSLPVLVLSADPDPSTPARALGLGANAYFAKPFSPSAMRKKLEELIHA